MAEHYRRFPNPPSNVPLAIERLSDKVVLTIKRDRATASAILARRVPRETLIVWKILGYGVVPTCLMSVAVALLFVWAGTRVDDARTKWIAFVIGGMTLGWTVLIALWSRRSATPPVILWTGRFPWRLELSSDRWRIVWQRFPLSEYAYMVNLSAVTRVYVNAEGRVIAYEGAQLMLISPPMLPEMSVWLSDALANQLGPHVLRDVAEDEAKFYTPS